MKFTLPVSLSVEYFPLEYDRQEIVTKSSNTQKRENGGSEALLTCTYLVAARYFVNSFGVARLTGTSAGRLRMGNEIESRQSTVTRLVARGGADVVRED